MGRRDPLCLLYDPLQQLNCHLVSQLVSLLAFCFKRNSFCSYVALLFIFEGKTLISVLFWFTLKYTQQI